MRLNPTLVHDSILPSSPYTGSYMAVQGVSLGHVGKNQNLKDLKGKFSPKGPKGVQRITNPADLSLIETASQSLYTYRLTCNW